jgi:DNA-binding CsgD family transcriptional regulator
MSATPLPSLVGRRRECAVLDDLLAELRAGRSTVCVIRGEAGVGKSVLLEYVCAQASGTTVVNAQGIEADIELAYASLHQLCMPFLSSVGELPEPQRDALQVAFGMAAGEPPDRFLVGLAVLSLLTRASEARPVLVVVDDVQWLDLVSLQTLEFVARRLLAEAVALVFTVRDPEGTEVLTGLPDLRLAGLDRQAAAELLEVSVDGRLDLRVRDRLLAETHGNPLALLELSRGRSAAELAYGLDAIDSTSLSTRLEHDFARRVAALPENTRTLLLVAAAEPVGDPQLLVRATELLKVTPDAAPAKAAGLLQFGETVRFRHPLARSAVYRAADPEERRSVHRALAEATDAVLDPDRRAWHAALASDGPDESVADGLEQAAGRARQRGGMAAEAVLLERAATLTPDPWQRGRRALAGAEAHVAAAAPDRAAELASLAHLCPLSPLDRARLARLRARMLFGRSRSDEAAPLLLDAAARFTAEGSPLARETYLEALSATVFAGRVHGPCGAQAVAVAARTSGAPASASEASDLLLDGIATLLADGHERGLPALATAYEPFLHEPLDSRDAAMRWLLSVPVAIESFFHHRWDVHAWDALSARAERVAREIGALSVLPSLLVFRAGLQVQYGDLAAATLLLEEADALASATGQAPLQYASLVLAAWAGDETAATGVVDEARAAALEHGEVSLLRVTGYVQGVLYNGLGRYEEALAAARIGIDEDGFNFTGMSLVEHLEAAVHSGELDQAQESLARLVELTKAVDTGWARGVVARGRAQLAGDGDDVELLFRTALAEFRRDRMSLEIARTHLVYGEWLRRNRRRADAREQLRTAYQMFDGMRSVAYAERAQRELLATGQHVRARSADTAQRLTAQEAQIATLAAGGMTNQKIGAELFLSPHTVEWHLRKVYSKLGIGSRRDLATALATTDDHVV